jgi:hypothetical protein
LFVDKFITFWNYCAIIFDLTIVITEIVVWSFGIPEARHDRWLVLWCAQFPECVAVRRVRLHSRIEGRNTEFVFGVADWNHSSSTFHATKYLSSTQNDFRMRFERLLLNWSKSLFGIPPIMTNYMHAIIICEINHRLLVHSALNFK